MAEPADTEPAKLHRAWRALLQDAGADVSAGDHMFDELVRAHRKPERFYHNLEHIEAVLRTIDNLSQEAHDLTALRFAAWFHDAVYDSRTSDNEERSAAWAAQALRSLSVAPTTVEAVRRLILLTRAHQAEPNDTDGRILLDADLAILGAPESEYRAYARAIRAEYAWVGDDAYRKGRGQVLRSFLARDRIYGTPALFAALEGQARRNLADELRLM